MEFLRSIYDNELSIRPKTRVSKIVALKEMIRASATTPKKVLIREALEQGATTHAGGAAPRGTAADPQADTETGHTERSHQKQPYKLALVPMGPPGFTTPRNSLNPQITFSRHRSKIKRKIPNILF